MLISARHQLPRMPSDYFLLCSVCLTDTRQTLATPSGSDKPPSLSDLLSTMTNSLTNQVKLILCSLKVCTPNQSVTHQPTQTINKLGQVVSQSVSQSLDHPMNQSVSQ